MSIAIRHVSKRFGDFQVLNNVSLDIPTGELVALLGPSGCGKTTLLRIIAGLEKADAGSIYLEGGDASQQSVRDRQVGFVFQHYALFRHMSVFENVAFGLRVKPRKERLNETEIRKKVMHLLELVQLAWLSDRYPSELSGGQRQRIALARALAVEPRVLLLDEPFGALDAKVRKELRRWLRQLHDEIHVTSVFVTHDQDEALEVSDTVVLMNKGQVEQIGTPDEVYNHPSTSFVASFLGSVNLFHGRAEQGQFVLEGHSLSSLPETTDSENLVGFVRPHEFEVFLDDLTESGLQARILRIIKVGPSAQIELDRGSGDVIEAILSLERLDELSLCEGMMVKIRPLNIRVFSQDGSQIKGSDEFTPP